MPKFATSPNLPPEARISVCPWEYTALIKNPNPKNQDLLCVAHTAERIGDSKICLLIESESQIIIGKYDWNHRLESWRMK